MCNIVLEKHFDRIKAAYEASVFTKGIRPESEDNIKITKKSFDLLIDRNADLPKQFCDSKVEIKDDTNEEKRYIIDSDSQDILKINFISNTSITVNS